MSTITGTELGEYLLGTSSNDIIEALGGNDILRGQEGTDTLRGGDGDDILAPDTKGPGDDAWNAASWSNSVSDGAADHVDGGAGFDRAVLRLDTVTANITADFSIPYILQTLADGTSVVNVEQIHIHLGSGNDRITLGSFHDVALGGAGDDWISAGAGNDSVDTHDGDDMVILGDGNDSSSGGVGNDTLDGGAGNDLLRGDGGMDLLLGGDGNDNLSGGGGDDVLEGGLGNDTFNDGDGDDHSFGGAGDDTFYAGWGTDIYDGGEGVDYARLSFTSAVSGVVFALAEGVVAYTSFGSKKLYGIDRVDISGSSFADRLAGGSGNDTLDGQGGDDMLEGLGGDDRLYGGDGNDTLAGGDGSDYFYGGAGTDAYYGERGIDTVYLSFQSAAAGVTFAIAEGAVAPTSDGNKHLYGIEAAQMYGSIHADQLTGGTGDDYFAAGDGNDVLAGLDGNDVFYGGGGDDTLSGGSGDDSFDGYTGTDLFDGGDGVDRATLYFSGLAAGVSFTLSEGAVAATFYGNKTLNGIEAIIAYGTSHDDTITGGSGADIFLGGSGNDILTGGDGDDALYGGIGTDVLHGGAGTDSTSLSFHAATAGVSFALVDGAVANTSDGTKTLYGIESATIYGSNHADILTGGIGNDAISGYDGDDQLNGGAGDDSLSGGSGNDMIVGGAGADRMDGWYGDDTFVVDDSGDSVVEGFLTGTDLVQASASFVLGENIENLTLTGTADIDGTGNAWNNVIIGNSGANVLDGAGGSDTMRGGLGDDTYHRDDAWDSVIEYSGEGTDTVYSSLTYGLVSGLENLVLTGTANINGYGNSSDNDITGNSADNVLNGAVGADTMRGGLGVDRYYIDNAGDTVVEQAGEGVDIAYSTITHALAANVEHLNLVGSATINGTGNDLNNTINGNSANNVLYGGGGTDTLRGGLGDDTYYRDNLGDAVVEASGQGTDLVYSSVSYGLGANLENLILTGSSSINGHGNTLGNTILGNAAANTLNGNGGNDVLNGDAGNDAINGNDGNDSANGGLGNDTLSGGAGADSFLFDTTLNASSNVDRITDFSVAADTIHLDNEVFTSAGATGTLAASAFRAGTSAQDADDRIIYDSATGRIYYDADGSGAGAQVLFAQVSAGLALTNADFQIVG